MRPLFTYEGYNAICSPRQIPRPVHADARLRRVSPCAEQQANQIYEDRANGPSGSNPSLTLQFTQSPADKLLNIANVSCDITVPSSGFVTILKLNAGSFAGGSDLGRDYSLLGALNSQT
jgi:hypothetical protein